MPQPWVPVRWPCWVVTLPPSPRHHSPVSLQLPVQLPVLHPMRWSPPLHLNPSVPVQQQALYQLLLLQLASPALGR